MIPKPVTIQLTVTAIHLTSPKVNCKLRHDYCLLQLTRLFATRGTSCTVR